MSKEINIHGSILPVQLVSKVLWLNPIKFNKHLKKYARCNRVVVYSIIFGLSSSILIAYLVQYAQISNRELDDSISQATFWFDLYAGIFLQIIGVLMSSYNAKIMAKLMNELISIDRIITTLGKKICHRNVQIFSHAGITSIAIEFLVTAIPDYVFFASGTTTKIFLIISYLSIITNGVIKLQFVAIVYLIFTRFQCLNSILKKLNNTIENSSMFSLQLPDFLNNNQNINLIKIYQIHRVHNHLSRICNQINWLYGFQILCIVASGVNITVTELFYCYDVRKHSRGIGIDEFIDIYFSMQWALIQQIEIFIIIWICVHVHKEARKTMHLLHSLQHKTDNEELLESIKFFSLHEIHKNVKFTACGLFPLDYTMLLMIYAAITSYLMIMIQYDMAMSYNKTNLS